MKFRSVFVLAFLLSTPELFAGFGLIGDYNNDGAVDEGDYPPWRKNLGTNNVLPNDFVGGTIGMAQFINWRANFGSVVAALTTVEGTPSVQLVKGGTAANGHLNSDGNWVWKVQITTSNPIPSGSSPLTASLGFKETASLLLDANNLSTGAGDDFDTVTPGRPIWGWENPGVGSNGFPEGLQSNCAGGLCTENTPGDDPNAIFASFGSQNYAAPTTADFIEIIAKGPSTIGSLTTSISMSGANGVGNNKGRIAEWSSPGTVNYDTFSGIFSRTAKLADANLDGLVNAVDYDIVVANTGFPNRRWQHGDFNGDSAVTSADLNILLANIPEPTSALLVFVAAVALMSGRARQICR